MAIVRLGSHRKLLPPINYAEKLLYKRPVSNGAKEIGPQPKRRTENRKKSRKMWAGQWEKRRHNYWQKLLSKLWPGTEAV
ncbi:hypothetical protein A7M48_23020 [Acinetobacter baumannii]|nr:hypothetical protein A7M48_23020 [Acinetobacter baumannii]